MSSFFSFLQLFDFFLTLFNVNKTRCFSLPFMLLTNKFYSFHPYSVSSSSFLSPSSPKYLPACFPSHYLLPTLSLSLPFSAPTFPPLSPFFHHLPNLPVGQVTPPASFLFTLFFCLSFPFPTPSSELHLFTQGAALRRRESMRYERKTEGKAKKR